MKFTYHLKILDKVPFGIFIFLTAEDKKYTPNTNYLEITDKIFLSLDYNWQLNNEGISFLKRGLLKVADSVHEKINDHKTVISISSLDFDLTDYQDEGLYWAIIGWLAQRYEFTPPKMEAYYDREQRKYIVNTD